MRAWTGHEPINKEAQKGIVYTFFSIYMRPNLPLLYTYDFSNHSRESFIQYDLVHCQHSKKSIRLGMWRPPPRPATTAVPTPHDIRRD